MTITIKFGGYQGDRSVHTRGAQEFCRRLQREAGDSIHVQFEQNIVDKGFKAADLLSKTESGELDGCYFSSSYLTGRVPELGLFDQHFVVPDRQHAYAVLDGALGKRLAEEVQSRTGFTVLGYWDNGLRQISSARGPIRLPADCKDLKLRTLKNEDHQRVFRALGFKPQAIDVRDLPAAVENHEVDAQENPLTNIYNFGLHKTHKHITLTQHLLGVAPVLFNQQTVKSWPESVREAVEQAIIQATQEQRRLAEEDDAICSKAIEADGCELITLTEAERNEFVRAVSHEVAKTRSQFDAELIQLFEADLAGVRA